MELLLKLISPVFMSIYTIHQTNLVKVTFSLSLHVICNKTAPLSSCIVSHEKAVSPSSSMTPAESVATSNDCPHESPQTISYGKLLQKDCDSHGCREWQHTVRDEPQAKYTEQNYKRNTFVFAPIFHELNSKI